MYINNSMSLVQALGSLENHCGVFIKKLPMLCYANIHKNVIKYVTYTGYIWERPRMGCDMCCGSCIWPLFHLNVSCCCGNQHLELKPSGEILCTSARQVSANRSEYKNGTMVTTVVKLCKVGVKTD